MLPIVTLLLIATFLASIIGLLFLIWSISTGQFSMGPGSAGVIFEQEEIGRIEEPAMKSPEKKAELQKLLVSSSRYPVPQREHIDETEPTARVKIDASTASPTLYLISSATSWLVIGSLLGLIASLKFQFPDWLTSTQALTFGIIRPLHLNTVIYGWISMVGMGVSIWLIPRLLKTELKGHKFVRVGTHLWNFAVVCGTAALWSGWTDGVEWLEYPWQIDILFVVAGALVGVPIFLTIMDRKVDHLYVSVWYIGAAFIWFPMLFLLANLPSFHFGVEHAIVNWWYAHNVLGLWITPFGLGAAYYFIPKVLGKPIHSYQLSLLGFWSLALFYSQVGVHHLIGGPVPTWLVTLSIVTSVMMIIPVLAVAINHHMTMAGHFKALYYSPTLLFIVPGAMMYTLVSFQGSMQSLRWLNEITHFTHATIAHAHLGVYGFASFIMFGSVYFILPRVMRWEWHSPRLIRLHFWLAFSGIMTYFVFLTIGGVLQGLALQNPEVGFSEIVVLTKPYLVARTIGGTLMTLSHFVFAFNMYKICFRRPLGKQRVVGYRPRIQPSAGRA